MLAARPRHDVVLARHRLRRAVRRPACPLGRSARARRSAARGGAVVAGARRAATGAAGCSRFLDPWADPGNTGYQTIQSLVGARHRAASPASASGASRAKWGFLPYAHTDFIFAIIGEELGLVGALLVVGLFVALGVLGVRTALRAPDRFGMLLAAGITAWIVGAGVRQHRRGHRRCCRSPACPLPFVSFGGSSLLVDDGRGRASC